MGILLIANLTNVSSQAVLRKPNVGWVSNEVQVLIKAVQILM